MGTDFDEAGSEELPASSAPGALPDAAATYEALRMPAGLPASWEVITALAWAPPPGAPIREAGMEVARFPAGRIPVRRR